MMGYALGKTGEMNGVSKSGEHRPQVTAGAIQLDELQEEIIEIGNKVCSIGLTFHRDDLVAAKSVKGKGEA